MGFGEVPFPGRVPKPILQGIVGVYPFFDWDDGDFDSGLESHDFLDHSLVGDGEEALPLVGCLDSYLGDLVEELVVKPFEGAVLGKV